MRLSDVDEELLELTTLRVPWYIVCGDFHRRYGSPGALARRLIELRDAELLDIVCKEPGAAAPGPDALEADALAHGCYADLEKTRDPVWEVVATDRGMALIRHRLDAQ